MYYMFGAGTNCVRAVDYWQDKNIIAIVDNDCRRCGDKISSVPIISFSDFMKNYNDETVIITAYLRSDEVERQLKKAGVTNIFTAPLMQSYFWNPDEIYGRLHLESFGNIIFTERNPLAERLGQYILELDSGKEVSFGLDETVPAGHKSIAISFGDKTAPETIETEDMVFVDLIKEMNTARQEEFSYLGKYRNIHKGFRCFIIGNGPSLRTADLDLLYSRGEYTFGSNGIYNIFDNTRWRPSYYCMGDGKLYSIYKDKLPKGIPLFMRKMMGEMMDDTNITLYSCRESKYRNGICRFSNDWTQGVYGGRTVTYDLLQIAAYMGFSKIYLLGVDFTSDGHFYKSAVEERFMQASSIHMAEQEKAYRAAEEYSRSHGFRIYNATRGGKLEVFERVDFDSLF